MGEGRKDRSSKRHRVEIEKSSSDTEVGRSSGKNRKKRSKKRQEKWPFLEGLTVDELGRYRRRRVENQPRDTLGGFSAEPTSRLTEYRRAFRAISEDSILDVLTSSFKGQPEKVTAASEAKIEAQIEDQQPIDKAPVEDEEAALEMALEVKSKAYEGPRRVSGVSTVLRRDASLRPEVVDFNGSTEYSRYVSHSGIHRAELLRRPTSLKMEGDMAETRSEQCEKFIEWLNVTRPELARMPTNLKLEGEIETTSESHDKYVPFVGARRPELLRQSSHLKLEGESNFLPEYMDLFREPRVRGKRLPLFPEGHLRTGQDLYEKREERPKDTYMLPVDNVDRLEDEKDRSVREKIIKNTDQDPIGMSITKVDNADSALPSMEIPEYKDAYKVFPRERPKIMKPRDEIGRADGIETSPSATRFQSKIDQDIEYKSKYLGRDRVICGKPPLSRSSVNLSCFAEGRSSREPRKHEGRMSEVRSQYVSYGQVPRVETLKMPANLRLEGNIDLHPEYRDAYCTAREKPGVSGALEPRAYRRRDRSLSGSRRRDVDSFWMNTDSNQINSKSDGGDAFQLLDTKVHEGGSVDKPLSGARRYLESSSPRGMPMRQRSPSLGYQPQTYHTELTDGEPRGRHYRHSPVSFQQLGERPQTPPGDFPELHRDSSRRTYSPSFGASHKPADIDDQAFVVLENSRKNAAPPSNRTAFGNRSRKFLDRNCNNIDVKSPRALQRNRSPTNWMPPWYDNTNGN